MSKYIFVSVLAFVLAACGGGADGPAPPPGTGNPQPSPTASASPSPSPTPSASPTPTPSASPTATPTASPTPTPSVSPSPTPTASPSPTPTPSPEPSPTGPAISVSFAQVAFPPLVKKVGVNQLWNETSRANSDTIGASAAARQPMISGLYEPSKTKDYLTANSALANPMPITVPQSGAPVVAVNPRLSMLRAAVGSGRQVNFLQIAGLQMDTAGAPVFEIENTTPSANGNWYPLPKDTARMPYLNALTDLTQAISTSDTVPTVFSFWQEPDHTLGIRDPAKIDPNGSPGKEDELLNLQAFAAFYRPLALQLRQKTPSAAIACCQQNQATGGGLAKQPVLDGGRYLTMLNNIKALEGAGANATPMDYFTIQNYEALIATGVVVANARYALTAAGTSNRFEHVPILVNEFSMNDTPNDSLYWGTSDGLTQFLNTFKLTIDQSDVAYVLPSRSIFGNGASLARAMLQFYGEMSELRRPVAMSSLAGAGVDAIAAGDAQSVSVLAWNSSATAQTVTLALRDLPAALHNTPLTVQTIANDQVSAAQTVTAVRSGADARLTVSLGAKSVAMVRTGTPAALPAAPAFDYQRQFSMVYRNGPTVPAATLDGKMPANAAQFDPLTSTLWLATAAPQAKAVGAALLSFASPQADAITLVPVRAGTQSGPLYVRLDFLDASGVSLKTVQLSSTGAPLINWSSLQAPWLPAVAAQTQTIASALESGVPQRLLLSAIAPSGWLSASAATRRVLVTAALVGGGSNQLLSVQLR